MNSTTLQKSAPHPQKPPSFFSGLLFKIFVIFTALALLLMAMLPSIASTVWGKGKLLEIVNESIPGNLFIDKISLNWFGPQEILDAVLRDPEGAEVLSLGKGFTSSSLPRLLWNKFGNGNLEIQSLNGTLISDVSGITNIATSLNKNCCKTHKIERSQAVTVFFKNVNATMHFQDHQPATVHINGETLQDNLKGQFAIDAQLKGIDINRLSFTEQNAAEILRSSSDGEFAIQAHINNLPVALIEQIVVLKNPHLAGILSNLLGRQLNLTLDQTATQRGMVISLNAHSPLFKAALEADISNRFTLQKPGIFQLTLTPELMEKIPFFVSTIHPWKLVKPSLLQITIDRIEFPWNSVETKTFKEFDFQQLAMHAVLSLNEFRFDSEHVLGSVVLKHLQAVLHMDSGNPKGHVEVKGNVEQNGQPFDLNFDGTFARSSSGEDFLKDIGRFQIQGDIQEFPIAPLDTYLKMNERLTNIVGDKAGIKFSLNTFYKAPLLTIGLKSNQIEVPPLAFLLEQALVLQKPAIIRLHLPHALINNFLSDASITTIKLQEPAKVELSLHHLMISSKIFEENQKTEIFIPETISLEADIALSPFFAQIPAIGELTINNFIMHLSGKPLTNIQCSAACTIFHSMNQALSNEILGKQTALTSSANIHLYSNRNPAIEEIHFQLINDLAGLKATAEINDNQAISFNILSKPSTRIEASSQNYMPALNISGKVEKFLENEGTISPKNVSLSLNGSIENFSVPLLCQLICLDPSLSKKLNAIIGSTLNANIKTEIHDLNGLCYVDLKGKNGHAIIDAHLLDGILTLNNNFYAELTVTPQLGTYVLQDLIPFLSGIIASDQPLKLAISRDQFAFPLRNFAIENITIGSATLEMGKVRFSNQGQIAKILSLLSQSTASEIQVWLTPTYFSLINGLVKLERVDMLISERYPIAAWGKVDLVKDNVNMVIGLSGASIDKAFNISSIKKNYLLQLPLKGTMSNPSIDKSKAVARVSALAAQSQGGPHGLILGTVLDIATGGFTENVPPQPTTQPLPWSALLDDSKKSSSEINPESDQNEDISPSLEKIGKTAGKLIKKIFKN